MKEAGRRGSRGQGGGDEGDREEGLDIQKSLAMQNH